jgi:serine/threonine-protein kinase HipA
MFPMKNRALEVGFASNLVGKITLTKGGLCAFEYAKEWLICGFFIAPFSLPLELRN